MSKKWTKPHHWNDPRAAFRRGLQICQADDWKPDFEPKQSVYCCLCLVDVAEKKILLVHKYDVLSSFGLPGGGMEPGETSEGTLFREILHESGYEIYRDAKGKLIGVNTVIDERVSLEHRRLIFFSLGDMRAPLQPIKETDEIDVVIWAGLDEIMAMPSVPRDPTKVDPNLRYYIKETHRNYVLRCLDDAGLLEKFGYEEEA